MDRRDMLDLLQADRRTDRILPNGYCLLPPVRSCDKGNACHGCDHFATDRSHLPEIRRQLTATEQLIEHRKAQHLGRYGEPMSDTNIWLEQRITEIRSMRLEITALQAQRRRHRRRPRRRRLRQARLPGTNPCPSPSPASRTRHDQHQHASSTASERRAAALRRAAQAKRQAATARADTAIRQLVKRRQRNQLQVRRPHRRSQPRLPLRQRRPTHADRKTATQQTGTPRPPTRNPPPRKRNIVHILTTSSARNATPAAPRAVTSRTHSPQRTANSSAFAAS